MSNGKFVKKWLFEVSLVDICLETLWNAKEWEGSRASTGVALKSAFPARARKLYAAKLKFLHPQSLKNFFV